MYHQDTFEEQARTLRGLICDYLERALHAYDWLREIRDELIADTPTRPRALHVTRMREDGEFASDLEIIGFMLMLKLRVTVVHMAPEQVPFACLCPLRSALTGHDKISKIALVNTLLTDTRLKELYVRVCVRLGWLVHFWCLRSRPRRQINKRSVHMVCTLLSCVSCLHYQIGWCGAADPIVRTQVNFNHYIPLFQFGYPGHTDEQAALKQACEKSVYYASILRAAGVFHSLNGCGPGCVC